MYIYTYMYTFIFIYMYVHTYICVHTYVYTYTYYLCVYIFTSYVQVYMYDIYIHICIYFLSGGNYAHALLSSRWTLWSNDSIFFSAGSVRTRTQGECRPVYKMVLRHASIGCFQTCKNTSNNQILTKTVMSKKGMLLLNEQRCLRQV